MFSGTEKSASGEPASGFENATGNGRSAQAGQPGCGKLEETADLDRMLQLLQSWALLHAFRDGKTKLPELQEPGKDKGVLQKKEKQQEECPVIAVAKDEAFCFYYEDNLRLLEAYGGKLVWFSPLGQEKIPEEADALLLGGGYPELCARQLSENVSMRNSIREAIEMVCHPWQSAVDLCICMNL